MTAGIAFLTIFFGISFRYSKAAYGILLALLPAYLLRFQIVGIPTTALELMVGVFLLAVLLTHYKKESWVKIKKLGQINQAVLGLVAAAIISVLVSPEPVRALGQFKAFFVEPILLFYAAVVIFKSKQELKTPLAFLFWSATLISLFGIVQYWTHLWLPLRFWGYGEEIKRITSVFEYPNALALYLAPVFTLFLSLFAKQYRVVKPWQMGSGLILMLIALMLTYSRGAWLGILAGLAVLLIKQNRQAVRKWAAGLAIALIVMSPFAFNRFKQSFNDASSGERVALYKAAVDKILGNPLLGNGLYGFRTTLEQNPEYQGEILNYPHNIILNFWIETGLLGIICFALIIFFALKRYKQKPHLLSLAAALFLVTMFVHGMVDAPYFKNDLSVLFWSVLAIFFIEE